MKNVENVEKKFAPYPIPQRHSNKFNDEIPKNVQLRKSAHPRAFSKRTFLDISTVEFVAMSRWFPPIPQNVKKTMNENVNKR